MQGEKRFFCPPVVNMGVGGESTLTILGRNGAIPYVVKKDVLVSKYQTPVPIEFTSKNGEKVAPLLQDREGAKGLNNVVINGIEGKISTDSFWIEQNPCYTFTRAKEGEETVIKKGSVIIPCAENKYRDYIAVIFMGQNGGYNGKNGKESPAVLIKQINTLIEHQTANKDKFLVVGLHTGTKEERKDLESAMQKEFKEKYFNLREYFSSPYGVFKDYNLSLSKEDKELIKIGKTPYRFLKMEVDGETDATHFMSYSYDIIGEQIYKRLDNLGYFNKVKKILESL